MLNCKQNEYSMCRQTKQIHKPSHTKTEHYFLIPYVGNHTLFQNVYYSTLTINIRLKKDVCNFVSL